MVILTEPYSLKADEPMIVKVYGISQGSRQATLRPISMGAGNRQGKTTVEKGLVKNLLAPTIITDEDFRDEAKALMFKGEFKRAWALIDMVIDKQIRGSA